jgi:tetratricopeptide (TPR) repeat protein
MQELEQKALALKAAGRFEEAAAAFAKLARLQPKNHGPLYNIGNTYLAANRPAEAIEPFRRATRLAPKFSHAHNNLGLALLATGQFQLAATSFARAAALDPGNPAPRHMMGNALLRAGDAAGALPHLRQANQMAPDQPQIMTDLADALRRTGALREVPPLVMQAARLAPHRFEAWSNLANALRDVCALEEAEAASRRALALNPGNGETHYNLALTLLAAGKLAEAWPHWEYRWQGVVGVAPRFGTPPWDGTKLGDATLYLHAEQGLGDTIQFCRYVPMAAARARIVLAVQPPLIRLLGSLAGGAALVALDAPPPPFAAHAPLLSLPGAFGTSNETIPSATPYLAADPAKAQAWASRLAGLPGLKVGLVWGGNPAFSFNRARSIPATMLQPLADVAGVSLVSLQVGERAPPQLQLADWTADLHDFAETAALIAGLDLVIGVDTAVVHLAGALGKPVWLLNRFASDWRWGMSAETTPWYPTLRIFRQSEPGDWTPVVASVVGALRK